MKINRLVLKNLNSLRGEFCLDFDDPPLADAGIFAITGPTGAGKTTILDAICVALYGQTPRLGAGSSGELLTRNTGECFAEVEFSVSQGRYRSRWSRRRARGLADGKLQPTTMELVELNGKEGVIVEDQVRQVIERVEALTGLDFARFTRSVLLAQGSFASFLRAKENERAELLERMTGTRLYSFISMAAFDRAREERQRLDELKAVNAHLDLMPAEQLAALQAETQGLEQGITVAAGELASLRARQACAAQYATLRESSGQAAAELAGVLSRQSEAGPDLARLALAEAAWPLQADVRSLDELLRHVEALKAEAVELAVGRDAQGAELDALRQARLALDQEGLRFAGTAAAREEAITQAERIDQQIALRHDALAVKAQGLLAIDRELSLTDSALLGQQEAINLSTGRMAELDMVLAGAAGDAGLGQDLSLLAENLQALAEHRRQFTANRREQERLALTLERLGKEIEGLRQQQGLALQTREERQGELDRIDAEMAAALQGCSCEELERQLATNRELLGQYDVVLGRLQEHDRLNQALTASELKRQTLAKDWQEAEARQQQLTVEKERAEQLLVLLEEKQALAARVKKYEAERRLLAAGSPCPLCGAQAHPWQAGVPAVDEDKGAVVGQRRQLALLIADIGRLNGRIQELQTMATGLAGDVATLRQARDGVAASLAKEAQAARLPAPEQALASRLHLAERMQAEQKRLTAARLAQAKKEAVLRELMAAEKAEATVAARLETALALTLEQQANVARQQEEEQGLRRKGAALSSVLQGQLDRYGLPLPGLGQEEASLEGLRARWRQYDVARQERAAMAAGLVERQQTLAVLHSQLSGLKARRQQEGVAAEALSQNLAALSHDRFALLQDVATVSARQRLGEERAQLSARQAESDKIMHGLVTQLATQDELLRKNRWRAEQLGAEAEARRQALELKSKALGLADLAALRQALLPEAELRHLVERRETLTQQRQRLEDRLQAARTQLATLGPEAATFDRQALHDAVLAATAALSDRQQELGARREKIRQQLELLETHRQRTLLIDRQTLELQRWQLLSDLIGSADGKKFRRFAQGLTLDHLIALANRQLIRLSERYLLRRHQDEELGLEIVDTYQADAIRPTGTLSGGEEFLVSLALALGLANLAGQTRIDSLFLDEGFGTLDTETLETALAALAALQESGKTIGVISHVDALKERIPVQIRLRKLAGGFSAMTLAA